MLKLPSGRMLLVCAVIIPEWSGSQRVWVSTDFDDSSTLFSRAAIVSSVVVVVRTTPFGSVLVILVVIILIGLLEVSDSPS